MAGISIPLWLNLDGLRRGAAQVRNILNRELGGRMSGLTKGLGLAGIAAGIGYLGKESVKLAMHFEQLEVAFSTILKSAPKAKVLMKELQEMAATTPYETLELADAAKSLVAFGFGAESVTKNLRMLGDLASGVAMPLSEIAQLYGKASVQGRLFAVDVNQFTNRGIPLIEQLAKQFGVNESAIMKMVENGQVGFKNLERAFRSMTQDGGQFAGMMDAQSKTLSGMLSTLRDEFKILGTEIGLSVLPGLKDMVQFILAAKNEMRDFGFGASMDSIGKRMLQGGKLVEPPPGRSLDEPIMKETAQQKKEREFYAQIAADRKLMASQPGATGAGMPGAQFLYDIFPKIIEEAMSRAKAQTDESIDSLFDGPKKGKGSKAPTDSPAQSVTDQLVTSLGRIGGATGIGDLAGKTMETLAHTTNRELQTANKHLAKLAATGAIGSYA